LIIVVSDYVVHDANVHIIFISQAI